MSDHFKLPLSLWPQETSLKADNTYMYSKSETLDNTLPMFWNLLVHAGKVFSNEPYSGKIEVEYSVDTDERPLASLLLIYLSGILRTEIL